jgi:hypothetical protein
MVVKAIPQTIKVSSLKINIDVINFSIFEDSGGAPSIKGWCF